MSLRTDVSVASGSELLPSGSLVKLQISHPARGTEKKANRQHPGEEGDVPLAQSWPGARPGIAQGPRRLYSRRAGRDCVR